MAVSWEFYRHMPVYGADRRRIGHLREVGHAVDYLHVQQGHLLVRDWYIPLTAVRDVEADGVYLAVNAAQMRANRWSVPPAEYLTRQGATYGYEYTSRSDVPAYGETSSPA